MLLGHDLSVVALIGIILLMGIVKKNAIMMIDFALDAERQGGLSPTDAIVQACRLRFRPDHDDDPRGSLRRVAARAGPWRRGGTRIPLGITIIGGLLLSQLITLYTTPVIYLELERLRRRLVTSPENRPVGHLQPELPLSGAAERAPLREAAE
jgi:multidrug efflux pump